MVYKIIAFDEMSMQTGTIELLLGPYLPRKPTGTVVDAEAALRPEISMGRQSFVCSQNTRSLCDNINSNVFNS